MWFSPLFFASAAAAAALAAVGNDQAMPSNVAAHGSLRTSIFTIPTNLVISSSAPITTTSPPRQTRECIPTVTVKEWLSFDDGCTTWCGNFGHCIKDELVTLPCGCYTADRVVTVTDTLCPTPNCFYCSTGFPFTTHERCTTTVTY